MILTKTFKPGLRAIELRVYVPWMKADEIAGVTDDVIDNMRNSLDLTASLPMKSNVTLCSNRAGLHYAFNVDCTGISWTATQDKLESAIARLKRAGWKESKGA